MRHLTSLQGFHAAATTTNAQPNESADDPDATADESKPPVRLGDQCLSLSSQIFEKDSCGFWRIFFCSSVCRVILHGMLSIS